MITVGPSIKEGGFNIIVSLWRGKRRITFPVVVEKTKTKNEAITALDFWVTTITNNPPLILRDIRNGEVIIVGSNKD